MASYSREYKEERVATAKLLGVPRTAAVWNIEPGVLYDWVRKSNMYGAYAFVGSGNKRPKLGNVTVEISEELTKKNKELKNKNNHLLKRNKELEKTHQIIKDALSLSQCESQKDVGE